MRKVRLGTRGSPMAVAQARKVARAIQDHTPDVTTELVTVTTSGDNWTGNLSRLGGKGAFIREIDEGLLAGDFDVAVHSMKDVPGDIPLPVGLQLAAYLPREQVHDALISRTGTPLRRMPRGARIGTSSVRRRAQLLSSYPQVSVRPIRGNVNTRLDKLLAGEFDALILASSGLARVDLERLVTELIPLNVMRPPVGSAVVVAQCRSDDADTLRVVQPMNDPRTEVCVTAERAFLRTVHGHCQSPISGYAQFIGENVVELQGAVFDLDGTTIVESHAVGDAADPYALGTRVAQDLIAQGSATLLDAIPH
jgi:hydroxymethylbilane synthase